MFIHLPTFPSVFIFSTVNPLRKLSNSHDKISYKEHFCKNTKAVFIERFFKCETVWGTVKLQKVASHSLFAASGFIFQLYVKIGHPVANTRTHLFLLMHASNQNQLQNRQEQAQAAA